MWWFDHGAGGWGFMAVALLWIGFWALVVTAAVLVVRNLVRAGQDNGRDGPERILAERFARGEIDEEEYRRRLTALRSTRS